MKISELNNNCVDLCPAGPDLVLDIRTIKNLLHSRTNSELSYDHIENLKYYSDRQTIEEKLNQTHEFLELIRSSDNFPIDNYLNIRDKIKVLEIENSTLTPEDFQNIKLVLGTINRIFTFFKNSKKVYPGLLKLLNQVTYEDKLYSKINQVIDDHGHVKSNASVILSGLRSDISRKEKEIERSFNSELQKARKNGWLSDESETIRHGERVLAFQANHKRKIKGVIIDQSSTGQTYFIQPESILELINEAYELEIAEKKEIFAILNKLTFQIREYRFLLSEYQDLLGELDFAHARALLAAEMNAIMPEIKDEPVIYLNEAFHPLLYLHNKENLKKTVSLNLVIDSKSRIIVISGPNAGGKSVCLKTIGLIQLMFQAGLLIPAGKGSSLGPFRKIFIDIGDNQSIENDLSTYSSHLKSMNYFLENADNHTLFMIDEFGSGTDPQIGGVIAERILNSLNRFKSYGVVTTHYANLKIFANETPGLDNAAFIFDLEHLKPTYQLVTGHPGSSYSFEILQNIGFEKKLIEEIGQKINEVNSGLDSMLLALQRDKIYLDELKDQIEKKEVQLDRQITENLSLKKKYDNLKNTIKQESKEKALEYLNNFNRRFEKMIITWQNSQNKNEEIQKVKSVIDFEKQKLSREIKKSKVKPNHPLKQKVVRIGMVVRLHEGSMAGQVVDIKKDKAIVIFGNIKTQVSLSEIEILNDQAESKEQIVSVTSDLLGKNFYPEIDLRGKRKDEALDAVEKFIDRALLSSFKILKIMHGTGDGILRPAIRNLLKKYTFIDHFESEKPENGGDGVTIIYFV